jgi:hypothetical protein
VSFCFDGAEAVNIDHVLQTLNDHRVDYLLIGGVNFLLRHVPVLTFDIDIWIEDTPENRARCEAALGALNAEWGVTDDDWKPVVDHPAGWLDRQLVFCLNSPHGAIDVFRKVAGLDTWRKSQAEAIPGETAAGVTYQGISDKDMLRCQLALDRGLQKRQRIEALEESLREHNQELP